MPESVQPKGDSLQVGERESGGGGRRLNTRLHSADQVLKINVVDPWNFGVDPDPDPRIQTSAD